jgi:hypothetical protein
MGTRVGPSLPARHRVAAAVAAAAAGAVIVAAVTLAARNGRDPAADGAAGNGASSTGTAPQAILASRRAFDPAARALEVSRPCTAADIHFVANDSAAQYHDLLLWVVRVTNVGTTPCVLPASAAATARAVSDARRLPAIRGDTRPQGVLLDPGGIAAVWVTTARTCGQPTHSAPSPKLTSIELSLGKIRVVLGHLALDVSCGDLRVDAPFLVQSPELPPAMPLTAHLVLPPSAAAGEVVRYSVVLTNTGSTDYSFGPNCPVYDQAFSGPDPGRASSLESYVLDCASSNIIPAHGSHTFDCALYFSRETEPGVVKLSWALDGGIHAGGAVELERRTEGASSG